MAEIKWEGHVPVWSKGATTSTATKKKKRQKRKENHNWLVILHFIIVKWSMPSPDTSAPLIKILRHSMNTSQLYNNIWCCHRKLLPVWIVMIAWCADLSCRRWIPVEGLHTTHICFMHVFIVTFKVWSKCFWFVSEPRNMISLNTSLDILDV